MIIIIIIISVTISFLKMSVSRAITTFRIVGLSVRFGGTYCFLLQNHRVRFRHPEDGGRLFILQNYITLLTDINITSIINYC